MEELLTIQPKLMWFEPNNEDPDKADFFVEDLNGHKYGFYGVKDFKINDPNAVPLKNLPITATYNFKE